MSLSDLNLPPGDGIVGIYHKDVGPLLPDHDAL
jgi:hypothetical protein